MLVTATDTLETPSSNAQTQSLPHGPILRLTGSLQGLFAALAFGPLVYGSYRPIQSRLRR